MEKFKRKRFSGYKKQKIGIELGIHDKNGNCLKTGDKVIYKDFNGIILYNPYSERYEFFYSYSRWYGDNEYNAQSYGKSMFIPMDNGAKMELELIKA